MSDPNFPWTGILFGAPILGVWYWCTDQFIVQRVLSGKNINESRRGSIFAGYLKLLPLFLFVIPGLIAYALTQKGVITLESPDHALPTLIGTLLPVGLKGIVVAGLLAALMSSLSSVFNSCSTLITWDIYKKLNPDATEKRLVLVGRVATAILVVFGLLWIPMMKLISGQIYQYLQSVQAYIAPPIAAIFLIGVLSKRVNSQGAIAALITGFVLGILRLTLELMKDSLNGFLYQYADINFLHFTFLLFLVCTLVLVVVSYFTSPPSSQKVEGLTIHTTTKEIDVKDKSWRKKDFVLSVLLILLVGAIWIYFS
jgi:SSS family solute:Na+ symporter